MTVRVMVEIRSFGSDSERATNEAVTEVCRAMHHCYGPLAAVSLVDEAGIHPVTFDLSAYDGAHAGHTRILRTDDRPSGSRKQVDTPTATGYSPL